jgi:hypothetical protein
MSRVNLYQEREKGGIRRERKREGLDAIISKFHFIYQVKIHFLSALGSDAFFHSVGRRLDPHFLEKATTLTTRPL